MEKKLFQTVEEEVFSPSPLKRVFASNIPKDSSSKNSEEVPLGFQSFGTKDFAEHFGDPSNKEQVRVKVTKFNKIKALSPANFFKDSSSKPDFLAREVSNSARAKTAIVLPAIPKTQSIYSPRMVHVQPNPLPAEKSSICIIDQSECTDVSMNNDRVTIEKTKLNVKSANVILKKQKSSAPLLPMPLNCKLTDFEINKLTKHASSPPVHQNVFQCQSPLALVNNNQNNQMEMMNLKENLIGDAGGEKLGRVDSKRKLSRFKSQEAVLKKIFNFNAEVLPEGSI